MTDAISEPPWGLGAVGLREREPAGRRRQRLPEIREQHLDDGNAVLVTALGGVGVVRAADEIMR